MTSPTTESHRMSSRVFLRPLGSSIPLGLAGLTGASLVSSGLELGWIASSEQHQVGLILLAFAFPLQLVASVFAFLGRDGAVGTTLGVLAGTWLCTGLIQVSSTGSRSGALGLLLLAAAGLVAAGAVATASGKLAPALVFIVVALRFALIGLFELGASGGWRDVGGVVGLAVVAAAGYTMLALALEDAEDRTVLPVGRRGRGLEALHAPFDAQLDGVEHEAGVRKQL